MAHSLIRPGTVFPLLSMGLLATASMAAGQGAAIGSVSIRLSPAESTASAVLPITGASEGRLSLTVGPVVERSTKEVLPATVVLDPAFIDARPNVASPVTVTVSNVLFEGDAEFDVLSNDVRIGTVGLSRAPLAVTLVDTGVVLRQEQTTALTLKNDSRYPYALRWMMQIGVDKHCGAPPAEGQPKSCATLEEWGVVNIPPRDSQTIEVRPPAEWFQGPGQYAIQKAMASASEQRADATLWLSLGDNLPKRQITVASSLQGQWYVGQTAWIFLILTSGAVFSLVVRHWVPNMQRKRELKDQCRRVRLKIDGFSDEVDAEVRSLTRVQVHLLDSMRKSTWTFLPDYVTVANQCAQGLAVLERRVDLIEDVDAVFASARVKWQACPPPSLIDRVDELLRGALDALRKTQLSDAELVGVRTQIDSARALTAVMGSEDAEFGKSLAVRLQAVRAEMQRFETAPELQAMQAELAGLFAVLEPPESPNDPVPAIRYALVDYSLAALQICRDYIWLVEGCKDAAIGQRLSALRSRLLQHLAHQSWGELRQARLLLKQFREDSTAAQVWDAIEAGEPAMYAVHEPNEVSYHQLVQFKIYFRRPELNWAGARELVAPEWTFSDGETARGWTISHFFTDRRGRWEKIVDRVRSVKAGKRTRGEERVSVSFEGVVDHATGEVRRKEGALQIAVPITRHSSDDRKNRTASEIIALAVSIFIPLVSLVTGAREQIAQNPGAGALTVFLLGFSSDALISVFKQRATPSS